jgi:hypothetical protein
MKHNEPQPFWFQAPHSTGQRPTTVHAPQTLCSIRCCIVQKRVL